MKKPLHLALFVLMAITCFAPQAFAVNRDMVQLQTQVQALQDAVARLQQSNDERMGALKDLIQQTADSVGKMSNTMGVMQRQITATQESQGGKVDQVSTQVQALNDSIDELKARLGRMEKALQDVQSQQQSINAKFDATPTTSGTAPSTTTTPPDTTPIPQMQTAPTRRGGKPPAGISQNDAPIPAPSTPAAPPVQDLYQTALGDYNGAKYPLATQEFRDVTKYYPNDDLSGNAYFYLGEIEYKATHYSAATKYYDKVLEQYPGNPKTATAQLRKGQSLLADKQNTAGVRELRSLIARYPNTSEATQARSKLNALGVTVVPKTR